MSVTSIIPIIGAAVFSTEGAVHLFLVLLVAAIVFAILFIIVRKAPFPEDVKTWLTWILYFLAALVLINFLLSLIGHPIVAL